MTNKGFRDVDFTAGKNTINLRRVLKMYTQFNERSLEETRCLLMEEMAKKHCLHNPVCWYDVCVDAQYIMGLDPANLEMLCRGYQWTEEDLAKLKNGTYYSPMWLYMGYLRMHQGSYNPIDYKLHWDKNFAEERRDIGDLP